jgi:hypothetical protein
MLDTAEPIRIDRPSECMKLVAQIAGGIFLAGLLTWVFWMMIFTAAAPKIAAEVNRAMPRQLLVEISNSEKGNKLDTPLVVQCKNFVKMASGERHCLEESKNRQTPAAGSR